MTVAKDVELERAALADSLEAVGPSASAGCGDWSALDLAAHIVAADRAAGTLAFCIRVLAARGVQFNPKPQVVAAAIKRERRRGGYPALLGRLRQRSPRLLLAPAVAASTLFEVWMHHDDLAMCHGFVHSAPDHLAHAIPPLVRYQAKHLPDQIIVRTNQGHQWTFGPQVDSSHAAVIAGAPADFIRWLSGRGPLGALDIEATPAVIEQLEAFAGTI